MIGNFVDSCFLWGLGTVLRQNDWKNKSKKDALTLTLYESLHAIQRSIGLCAVLDCPCILILKIGNEMSGFLGSVDKNVFSSNSNTFCVKLLYMISIGWHE